MLCQDDATWVELNCTLQEGMPLLGHVDSESRWNCLKNRKRKKQKDSDTIISRTQVLLDGSLPRDRFQGL